MGVAFGVLGPVTAWDGSGGAIALKGPRHRAVLARLIVARGRVVPVTRLVDDLWEEPPAGAVGAVRTFVAALRRALEPDRPPRAPARLLVTEGPGYALRAGADAVDAWRFEHAVTAAAALPPHYGLARLEEALGWWRGPAYAEFADQDWVRAERSRLAELRLHAAERRAEALLALGRAAEVVPDLDAHAAGHPWREDAWRLLALALYRSGRQGDALAVLRRARTLLVDELGVDPGPALRRLETDILRQADHLDSPVRGSAERVWAEATAAYDRAVASGARARLESTTGLLRDLAVTGGGGPRAAGEHRVAAVEAAEELGDAELTARVIGAFDVPAIWTRSDDPGQAARIVAAAGRTLAALAPDHATAGHPAAGHEAARARLLATIALESRGDRSGHGRRAARQAEEIARRLGDPALLAFALSGLFMQTFHRTGLAARRDEIGAELVELSARHGLVTFEVLGRLIRMQARSALADFTAADAHAAEAEHLAVRHERPLVGVFTTWYRALRLDASGRATLEETEAAYRQAAARLDGAGMPGMERGLLPLALLCLRLRHGQPPPDVGHAGWGPYAPWARPVVLLARDRRAEAAEALRALPEPPPDLLTEALWCLAARAALTLGDRTTMERAHAALLPAAGELAGAGSGVLTLGPVSAHLDDLAAALNRPTGIAPSRS
ncbi:BTAD domain-containing putative transcriptional regulator [Microbispora sp. NPDC088329]|uniref:AfsR/SARP family transcriptional regulator n=1 Tax=Microbispora sp. NPDC088329 TaxID=3154869 RepID=UPI0034473B5E